MVTHPKTMGNRIPTKKAPSVPRFLGLSLHFFQATLTKSFQQLLNKLHGGGKDPGLGHTRQEPLVPIQPLIN